MCDNEQQDLLQKIADILCAIKSKVPANTSMQYTDQCIDILDTIAEIGMLPKDKARDVYVSILLAHTECLFLIEEGSDIYKTLEASRAHVVEILSILTKD